MSILHLNHQVFWTYSMSISSMSLLWVFGFSFKGSVHFLCGSAELSQAITPNGAHEACLSSAHSSALMVIPPFTSVFYPQHQTTILFIAVVLPAAINVCSTYSLGLTVDIHLSLFYYCLHT